MSHGIRHDIWHGIVHGARHNQSIYGAPAIVAPTPAYQATGTKAEGAGDVTVAWPTHVADDVALLFVESNGSEAAVLGTPAGFVEVSGSPVIDDTGGNTTRLTVFWCRATGASMTSPVVTDPGNHCEAVIITYRGCRTFDVPYSAVGTSTTETVPATAVTVAGANTEAPNCRVVIAISNGGGWDASGYTNTALDTITERFDDYTSVGGAGGLSIADGEFEGPGDYGDTTATMGASQICAMMSIALTGSSGGGESAVAEDALSPLGTPITASRIWTTGLSDDDYFILQAYNYGTEEPPEWTVFNLPAGTYETYLGPAGVFANSNFQCADLGAVSGATGGSQVRASSGRIFFPLRGLNIAYYDPTDHEVHHLPAIVDPTNVHAVIFRLEFGNDGLLYGTTQVDSGTDSRPAVFSLDPVTLETVLLGHVGTLPNPLLYGYYLAAEDGGSLIYVAVGQNPWELWSLDTATGVSTQLIPTGFPGPYTHIEFNKRTEGWTARFAVGASTHDYWVADGVLYDGAPTHNPADFTARDVTEDGPSLLVDAADVDWEAAVVGVLKWRDRGDPTYTEIPFDAPTAPIGLSGLAILPDGDFLVCAEQYNGFARRDGDTWTHNLAHIISQPVFAEQGTWFTGYPNGVLWNYDPDAAWAPGLLGSTGVGNPAEVGDFSGNGLLSNMKYAYFLVRNATNNRLYSLGRLERSGDGGGLAYYDITGESFEGHHDSPLDEYIPRGMLMLEAAGKILVSGQRYDEGPSKILVYDMDLTLIDQLDVSAEYNNGFIFPGSGTELVGVTNTGAYRYDYDTETVTGNKAFGLTVTAVTQRADGQLLIAAGTSLFSMDPDTLETTPVVTGYSLGGYYITSLSWIGAQMLALAGPTLYEVV